MDSNFKKPNPKLVKVKSCFKIDAVSVSDTPNGVVTRHDSDENVVCFKSFHGQSILYVPDVLVMASTMLSYLQNIWPFSLLKSDDLKLSNQLVRPLPIPDQTKQFIFAAREPDSNAVVYILAAQNLSEQSASDAEHLIKQVQPRAVVAQVASSALDEIQAEEKILKDDRSNTIPTSSLGVLKRCLIDKVNKEQYDKFAGCQVLKEIFGVGFHGHFLAAKKAAEEVDSHFLLLESPHVSARTVDTQAKAKAGDASFGLNLQPSGLLSSPVVYSSSRRLCLTDALQSQMVKSLIPSLELLLHKASVSDSVTEVKPSSDEYEAPQPFAQSVYPLLADLYDIFSELPAIGKALASAQKMLVDVNKGEPVDTQLVSQVHSFRIAIEGLRIALNNAARCPNNKTESENSKARLDFSELPSDEKCHVLFAQALRSQARKYGGSVVAIVDAGSLAGLRRHWNTPVPPKIAELADECFAHHYSDDDADDKAEENVTEQNAGRKRLLADKPMVAVGAGATAVLGVTSLSKAVPVSTLVKATTYKVPAILKFGLAQIQRHASIGLAKILGPSKLLAPGMASAGAKSSATFKLAVSAENIRVVTHSMIASAERTSLLAIRTSFYEIMRRRRAGPLRLAPWATFGCSIATCSGLLMYGDGIECVAESIPSVPTIASLGRGLQSLQQASQEVGRTSGTMMQEALQVLMYNFKNSKKQ